MALPDSPQYKASQIRQALVDTLKSVDRIGKVQLHQRFAKRSKELVELYGWADPDLPEKEATQIRGWFVRRSNIRQLNPATRCDENKTQVWEIHGFMQVNDEAASELQFDYLLDVINDTFNQDLTFGGLVTGESRGDEYGLQLTKAMPYVYAGVLMHGATFKLTVNTF